MEGAPFYSPENTSDKDDTDKKTKEKRGKEVGRIIAGAEKPADVSDKKEKVAKESASLLEKIFGGDKQAEAKPVEPSNAEKPSQDNARAEREPAEATHTAAAEAVAADLAAGVSISHEDLRNIPQEQDETVVHLAVEKAMANEAAAEVQPDVVIEAVPAAEETPEDITEPLAVEALDTTAPVEATPEESVEDDTTTTSAAVPPARPASTSAGGGLSASGSSAGGGGGRSGTPFTPAPVGGGGTLPPPPTRPFTPSSPYGRRRSASPTPPYAAVYPSSGGAPVSPGAPNVLHTTRAVEEAEDQAFRRGRNRGLVAGLIVGGGIEHIRHKRREKKMERIFAQERKEQARKVEDTRWDQIREAEAAKVREAAAAKYRTVERPPATAPPEVNRTSQTEAAAERRQIEGEVKKQLEAEHKKEQQVLTKAEEIEEQRQRELLDIAQGNHVERSAWHNIEVDSHGKVVQETSFEYGHEYYSERAKEVDPKAKQHVDIAAGEVALVAAALSGGASASTTPPASPSARTARAVPSGQGQSSASAKPASAQPQSVLKTVTSPPTTIAGTVAWFVALVVIVVVFVFVAL